MLVERVTVPVLKKVEQQVCETLKARAKFKCVVSKFS
jgi:hypothetical protein